VTQKIKTLLIKNNTKVTKVTKDTSAGVRLCYWCRWCSFAPFAAFAAFALFFNHKVGCLHQASAGLAYPSDRVLGVMSQSAMDWSEKYGIKNVFNRGFS
jgi:hypothetical protein